MKRFASKSMRRNAILVSAGFDAQSHQQKQPMGIRNAMKELSRIERQIKGEEPASNALPKKSALPEFLKRFLNMLL